MKKSILSFILLFVLSFSVSSQECGYQFNGIDSYLVGDIGPVLKKIDDESTVTIRFKMNSIPGPGKGFSTVLVRLTDADKQFSNVLSFGVLNWDNPNEAQFFISMYADWLVDHHMFENETEVALKMFEVRAITTNLVVGEWYTVKAGSTGTHPVIRINGRVQNMSYYAQKQPGQWIHNLEKTIVDGFPEGVTRITFGAQKTDDIVNPRFLFDGVISKFKIKNTYIFSGKCKPGTKFLGNNDDADPNIPKKVIAYDFVDSGGDQVLDSGIYSADLDIVGNGSFICE